MNSLHLWMGIAIGTITALLIILAIVHFAGNANAEKAKAAGDRNFTELQLRNQIGRMQVSALQVIGQALINQQEVAVEMRDILKTQNRLLAPDDEWDDSDDEERADPLAEIKRQKESWQAETIRLENDLNRTREERNTLCVWADQLLDIIDHPPEPNCACHISPPCNDCTEHSGLREAITELKSAIGAVTGRAE